MTSEAAQGKVGAANENDTGLALIVALIAMLLLLALGLALVLNTAAETMIAAHFTWGQEAFYAADAGLEHAMDELERAADWNAVLQGATQSSFVDGPPAGTRRLADRSVIDLSAATNLLNCAHPAACAPAEMDAATAARPWGTNNPRWTLYAFGPVPELVPLGTINSNLYMAVWVSDDVSENDDDPMSDGEDPSNPGSGVLTIHAEAFGPGGAHRVLEATIRRCAPSPTGRTIQLVSWRQL